MKIVLFINSSNARYFKRTGDSWQLVVGPGPKDKIWVIANIAEETLETLELPVLFGRDRSLFLERRLAAAFPNSHYRAAPVLSVNLLKPGTVLLTGLTSSNTVTKHLEKLDAPIAGVWGISMLLTLMAKHLAMHNVVLSIPSVHYLRILVIKEDIPVITRCIHRYREDENSERNDDANEILRTCQHLENRHFFEHGTIPPVLYLGESTQVAEQLTRAGLTLQPLPEALAPRGDAAYLHPLLEQVTSSPHGQLAPLHLRARHLTGTIHKAAYIGIAACFLAAILFGQKDFRLLNDLHGREKGLNAKLAQAINQREQLAAKISASGTDPALVRQATQFSTQEIEAAPMPESLFKFTASAIADLPQVRIKSLTYRFPKPGQRYCQEQSLVDLPLISGKKPSGPDRHTELQFSILLIENLAPLAQAEIRKHISAALKTREGVQLIHDPATFSLINTLKGGVGMDTAQTENLWCMSVPWHTTPHTGGAP